MSSPSRSRDHIPPLLRALGLLLALISSLAVGFSEHSTDRDAHQRLALIRTQSEQHHERKHVDAVANELYLLRLQLSQHDLVDRVLDNRWFQVLAAFSTALLAISFAYEAWLKWPKSEVKD